VELALEELKLKIPVGVSLTPADESSTVPVQETCDPAEALAGRQVIEDRVPLGTAVRALDTVDWDEKWSRSPPKVRLTETTPSFPGVGVKDTVQEPPTSAQDSEEKAPDWLWAN
jgi:hypothetical protein